MTGGAIVALILGGIALVLGALALASCFILSGRITEAEEAELVECGGEAPAVVAYGKPQQVAEWDRISIDVNDSVHHGPTGEDWVVAAIDGPDLYWCGYPFGGSGKLADCTLLERSTPEGRDKLLRQLADMVSNERPCTLARARVARLEPADDLLRGVPL